MKISIYKYSYNDGWDKPFSKISDIQKSLIVVFGTSNLDIASEAIDELVKFHDGATIVGASTSGEIYQDMLLDDTLVVAQLEFSTTTIKSIHTKLTSSIDSYVDGEKIAINLLEDDLKGIFVLSDGLNVNGSQLTKGISSILSSDITVTGGLAGDGDRFEKTWVVVDGKPCSSCISAVGFYGEDIHIGYGSKGGWDRLGIERVVTKSDGNILYELDSQPALALYKRYLGDKADGLPATGLLFPLELRNHEDSTDSKVRTILAIDEERQSITFAGDIPEGSFVTLMKANFDRLIDGAIEAAEAVDLDSYRGEEIFNIAISCVGRRLVLKQRVEEELEDSLSILPPDTKQIGFYSYGEISPLSSGKCDLHNQTMTFTTIWESDA
ncbi:Blr2286 protein [hydrothermal vent metagenome]|uniref:Blr2286 protein n=1 Tax=hydrothermal vent metagenome TaxID=652676 RepID=A0A1W1BE04_9ZZZZ